MKTPLEVVGAPPEAPATNDLGNVGIGGSWKGVKLLRELVRIRLVLVLLEGLLLAITLSLSRGRFAPFLGVLGLGILVSRKPRVSVSPSKYPD